MTIKDYVLSEEKPNIIFTIALTRQCNLRCNYCWIDFSEDNISYNTIIEFLKNLESDREKINEVRFEFFWWEPLLELEKIKLIVEKTKNLNIKYSIVTNGFYLTEEIIDYLNDNNFEIVFSVAIHTKALLKEKESIFLKKDLKNFIINLIIEPQKELEIFDIFTTLIKLGFKKITILPVYYTKIWEQEDFKNLDISLKKISKFYFAINKKYPNLLELFYIRTTNEDVNFNIIKKDVELFLDYNGEIYWDYDTELRLLNDFVPDKIFSIKEIYLWNIYKSYNLFDIIKKRKKINTIDYIEKISNYYNLNENLETLWKVLRVNNVNIQKNVWD